MRAILLFVVGLLVGACGRYPEPPAQSPSTSGTQAASASIAQTVALVEPHLFDSEISGRTLSFRVYCSGVWISETDILTAHHCVSGDGDPKVGDPVEYVEKDDVFEMNGTVLARVPIVRAASVQALDESHDLALLRTVAGGTHPAARISLAPIYPGERVHAVGHPMGCWWSYSSGDVAAVRKQALGGHDLVWVQATAPISPGNSGGGLFNESGALIGIASGALGGRAQNINFFVHAQYLDALVRGKSAR